MGVLKVEEVTPEQIKGWKDKHKQVIKISIPVGTGKVQFMLGRPTRSVLDNWVAKLEKDDAKGARDVLKANCILAGDTSIFDDDVNVESTVMKNITKMCKTIEVEEEEL